MTQPVKNPFPTPIRPLRSRQNRRILVVLSNFFLVVAIGLAFSSLGLWALVAFIISAILGIVLQFATRNLSNSVNLITDERERYLRDHAHRIAYWAFSGIVGAIVGFAFSYITRRNPDEAILFVRDMMRLETQVILLAFFAIFLGLPTTIIAWLEPDALED